MNDPKNNLTAHTPDSETGLYIVLISIHGLMRGHNLELGRDADTGGQTKYIIELARALSKHPKVTRVDLLTRQVFDNKVDADYAEPMEQIDEHAYIVRLPCGPRRYLRKEVLWSHMDSFADHALQHIRRVGHVPDIIHGHYADAGYVGTRLAALLGTPFIFTGHSLGRVKRLRLIERGVKAHNVEAQYNITRRIEAEEQALDSAAFVVASTAQEIEEQYEKYDNYQPKRIKIIAPGIDLSRFRPPTRNLSLATPNIKDEIEKFLKKPKLPMVLALSRADERKNIASLVRAFAEHDQLRKIANLVIVAGNRDDIQNLDKGAREVLNNLLHLIDRYDLYGSVAIPKHHAPHEVPDIYRLAAGTKGVFVNPALTEPFGLTLLEAAASGLPIIATEDGGPRDIIKSCKNGRLINPLNPDEIGEAIYEAITNKRQWRRWAKNGLQGVNEHYSWEGHVNKYIDAIEKVAGKKNTSRMPPRKKSRLPTVDRIIVCDIDNTLIGNKEGLTELLEYINPAQDRVAFGVATGRTLKSTLKVLKEWKIPVPDLLITSVGCEIYYGHRMLEDTNWQKHTNYRWSRDDILKIMSQFPGLRLQSKEEQRNHKISYFMDPVKAPNVNEMVKQLRRHDLHANLVYSHQAYLDLLPLRASKGLALRYVGMKWGLLEEHCLVAGDSGNDMDMLSGDTLGIVVGNHSPELKRLKGKPRIYFAKGHNAWGVLEGMKHFNFLNRINIPEEELEA